jgi:hypothetical protein
LFQIFTEKPIDKLNLEKEMLSSELLFKELVQVMLPKFSDSDLELVIWLTGNLSLRSMMLLLKLLNSSSMFQNSIREKKLIN